MGTFFVIVVIVVLLFLLIAVKQNSYAKEQDWKQEQDMELQKQGINKSVEYYYAYSTLAFTARYIVDNDHKKIALYSSRPGFAKEALKIFDFDEILGFETFIDSQNCGGVRRAVIGGAIAGLEGALIGATTAKKEVTSFKVVFYLKDIYKPEITLSLLESNTQTSSINYINAENFARKVNASVKAILSEYATSRASSNIAPKAVVNSTENKINELKEIKSMLDAGVITQDDYDKKKKQIIGL